MILAKDSDQWLGFYNTAVPLTTLLLMRWLQPYARNRQLNEVILLRNDNSDLFSDHVRAICMTDFFLRID